MPRAPLVTVMLLNYRMADDTIACVRSLEKVEYPSVRILVLDNASNGDDVARLSAALPGVPVKLTARNLGYTGGVNAGIRWSIEETSPEYILVLNPDTRVEPDFLDHLVRGMESHPRAAVAGGTIYMSHRPTVAWFAGGRMIPWRGLAVHDHKGEVVERAALGEPRPVTFVTGCLALYRVSALARIGEQDERFFLYLDDIEMSARIARQGFELLYVPKAVIHHKVKGSEENPLKLYYSVRNRLLLVWTAYPLWIRIVASLYFACVISLKMLVWLVVNREFLRASAMGLEDFVRGRFGEGRGLTAFGTRGDAS